MEARASYIRELQNFVARMRGSVRQTRMVYGADLSVSDRQATIAKLPVYVLEPPIDLDPNSPTFGQWKSLVDLTGVDQAPVV